MNITTSKQRQEGNHLQKAAFIAKQRNDLRLWLDIFIADPDTSPTERAKYSKINYGQWDDQRILHAAFELKKYLRQPETIAHLRSPEFKAYLRSLDQKQNQTRK